ncbi:MAG: hypothetical protein HZB33_02565 [Nitrospirae bacterium]|nr:hypothetical protein [Nitrospirota bacterium]
MSNRPLASVMKVKMSPPSPADKTADADRLLRALKEAGYAGARIPHALLRDCRVN